MPRVLSDRTLIEIAKAVTNPFWLVYIGFDTPLYKSSGAAVTWNSLSWVADDIQITMNADKNIGTLTIQNTDYIFGGQVLTNGISDVPIVIYQIYGGASTSGSYVDEEGSYYVDESDGTYYDIDRAELLFSGVGGEATVDLRWVTIELKIATTSVMFSPRIRCTKEMGFNYLPVGKMVISLNGEQYTLEVSESG